MTTDQLWTTDDDATPPAPAARHIGLRERGHCGREACRCTHTDGCDFGWVEMPPYTEHQVTYRPVAPCPVCRPESYQRLHAGSRNDGPQVGRRRA